MELQIEGCRTNSGLAIRCRERMREHTRPAMQEAVDLRPGAFADAQAILSWRSAQSSRLAHQDPHGVERKAGAVYRTYIGWTLSTDSFTLTALGATGVSNRPRAWLEY